MNRIIIGLTSLVIVIVILSGVYHYFNRSHWKPFRCDTHLSSHIATKEGKKLELNLDISIITAHEGSSEALTVGSLKGEGKNYIFSRRVFVTMKQSDFKGFSKAMIIREERHPIDNVPDEIWQEYVLPEAPGVAFYMETKHLNNNAYLIKGLTNPHFVCARTLD
ncbi:FidL-like protein [Serratia fonticola]|jgi:hypothetical protein|uniref:Uncharacterized protein n=1 Tax=Serratia fonticola TaxID=47917 RepID=A0AAJ2DB07_SERFO|nr:FidL-like protein [Serratia fonticola]MDQ7212082.1 hypothetical protein [Serratia fonticola]MDQ9127196.1 hypothetical protein [Serratia fonticola]OKP30427.1 hypothetical protein BSQ40_04260 [Serratia fonticola]HBE9082518.1 hypothetical protein [Serratia fonticola]HBE9093464.1 hypothetical protein [Serratia fonticola]